MKSMNRDTTIFQKILTLRFQNKGYREIAKTLGVSKSTVSYWLADNQKSQAIRTNLSEKSSEENGKKLGLFSSEKWKAYRKQAAQEATEQFPTLSPDPLFIAGIMLYWGEGDSNPKNPLRISNTNPNMIALFVKFLTEKMAIATNKIKIGLVLYPDLSDSECKSFWSKTTALPMENFMKTQFIVGKHPTKRIAHGVAMVVVHSRHHKTKILRWIEIFSQKYTMNP